MPRKEYIGWLKKLVNLRANCSDIKRVMTPLPSRGGTGSRLKTSRSRFSIKNTLSNFAKPAHIPAFATTMPVKLKTSGLRKTPDAKPILRSMKVAKKIKKLAAGPAAAIQAARRGYFAAQRGSYGALAQPIIQPAITKEIIGLVKAFKTTDYRFSFPAVEAFRILLIKPVENKSTVITPEHVQPTEQQKKIVEYIISTSNNVTCILGDKDNPTYLFNKKTNSLSTVHAKDTIISINETPSQKIYALSPNIVKYLELEEIDHPIKIKKFSNSSDLITYVKKDSDLQGVVLFK